ncbi:MAG: DNA repair protein RecN [Rhodospirillales bacterium]|jgi:DNA repair protein RecN (Recombination protein N)|nr:DNA repair protein RecN [Rhodospirillales bacterium]MBT4006818.1 DNA repair protein RecN [Rhodospirillales bacterium]MBT5075949.1 DNA repair protein RecN [Rhodospirillales bacterium]MBT5113155.1 DNA repair protein RecN [Rhodospirillales bacterium]MBT5673031.1 DNA repair protein RecN [Rhodospirillales bacterium]
MLTRLSIHDVVLIDRLDLDFQGFLSVLTGETGAGKSILLDALGLALGARGDSALIRSGATRAQVSAEFDVSPVHPGLALMEDRDLDAATPVILRRILGADGRSRAYVNDQPISIGFLSELGDTLAEIHGQHETRGLLNPTTHRTLLDVYGNHEKYLQKTSLTWSALEAARTAEHEARELLEAASRDQEFLRHAVTEIETFAPEPGEEASLADERRFLSSSAKLAQALISARESLERDGGIEGAISGALIALEKVRDDAGGRFDAAITALERASLESTEAFGEMNAIDGLNADPGKLSQVEDRLFGLRALARKYDVSPDDLADHGRTLAERLSAIDNSGATLEQLAQDTQSALKNYDGAANALSAARKKAASRLDKATMAELPPLKLEKAIFKTGLTPLDEADYGPFGHERVGFEITTNPGSEPGPLHRVASGGELARIMLALRVVLAGGGTVPTLIFDEVDAGISGATADAVGVRLAQLSADLQILVITHSPQVAARGAQHFRVAKQSDKKDTTTVVEHLNIDDRREEVARMLAGKDITPEARAAADKLLAAGG